MIEIDSENEREREGEICIIGYWIKVSGLTVSNRASYYVFVFTNIREVKWTAKTKHKIYTHSYNGSFDSCPIQSGVLYIYIYLLIKCMLILLSFSISLFHCFSCCCWLIALKKSLLSVAMAFNCTHLSTPPHGTRRTRRCSTIGIYSGSVRRVVPSLDCGHAHSRGRRSCRWSCCCDCICDQLYLKY